MTVDFGRKSDQPEPVAIEGKLIERVLTYRYLGVLSTTAGSRIRTHSKEVPHSSLLSPEAEIF